MLRSPQTLKNCCVSVPLGFSKEFNYWLVSMWKHNLCSLDREQVIPLCARHLRRALANVSIPSVLALTSFSFQNVHRCLSEPPDNPSIPWQRLPLPKPWETEKPFCLREMCCGTVMKASGCFSGRGNGCACLRWHKQTCLPCQITPVMCCKHTIFLLPPQWPPLNTSAGGARCFLTVQHVLLFMYGLRLCIRRLVFCGFFPNRLRGIFQTRQNYGDWMPNEHSHFIPL